MKDRTTGMTVRNYIPPDIGGILRVFELSVKGLCAYDYSPSQLSAWTACADKDKWDAQFSSRKTFVAIAAEDIVGFCDIEDDGHIDRLYVTPSYARKGVGSALVKAVENAVNAKVFTVEASVTAKPFFEKLGYTVTEKQTVERHGEKLVNFKMKKNR